MVSDGDQRRYSVLFRLPVVLEGELKITAEHEGQLYSLAEDIIRKEKSLMELFRECQALPDYDGLEVWDPEVSTTQ